MQAEVIVVEDPDIEGAANHENEAVAAEFEEVKADVAAGRESCFAGLARAEGEVESSSASKRNWRPLIFEPILTLRRLGSMRR